MMQRTLRHRSSDSKRALLLQFCGHESNHRVNPRVFSLPAELQLDDLVPPSYAAYRPLVRDALTFFVRNLPQFRIAEIAADQMRLPAGTLAPARLVVLLQRCPTLHKLGQVLARDRRLSSGLRAQLTRLESLPATTDLRRLMPAIRAAVGDAPGIIVGRRALAEASVAVVVPFSWRAEPRRDPVRGVMKVLKPGIRDRLEEELSAWSGLGTFVEDRRIVYGLPDLDYRGIIDGVASRLRHEVLLSREQAHMAQAARLYREAPRIHVPALFPFCTSEVTAMSHIRGVKLTEAHGRMRPRAVESMVDALLARPLLSRDGSQPFHADPHPGNLILTEEGDLAILDWSLVARLHRGERHALFQILFAALGFDEGGMRRALHKLATVRCREEDLARVCADSVRQLRWGKLPGLRWMTDLLDRAVTAAGMAVSEDLWLFRKALYTLTGIAEEMSTAHAMDAALLASGLRQYLSDSVGEIVKPARAGSTTARAVNTALFGLWCQTPSAAARFWLGAWRELMAAGRA